MKNVIVKIYKMADPRWRLFQFKKRPSDVIIVPNEN